MNAPLSLEAEFMLLAIDPARGGLLATRSGVRRALRAARQAHGGVRARRGAVRELRTAGRIDGRGRLRLADRRPAAERFESLRRAIVDDNLGGQREIELFVLLAVSGVLTKRLTGRERRLAVRRLRALGGSADGLGPSAVAVPRSGAPVSPIVMDLAGGGQLGVFAAAALGGFDASDGGQGFQ